MNATITRRCIWREYRMGRSFWIAILLLTIFLQLTWLAQDALWQRNGSREVLWNLAVVMPLIYALGLTATAFSREHETGSYAFLRQLPLTPRPLWLAKLGFTWVSSLLLLVCLAIVTALLGGRPSYRLDLLILWMFWLVTVAGIGTLCSQLIRRPLVATFTAGGVLAVVGFWPSNQAISMEEHLAWLNRGPLFIVGLIAVAASVPMTTRWLDDRLRGSFTGAPSLRKGLSSDIHDKNTLSAPINRLIWVAWRRIGWLYGLLILLGASVIVIVTEVTYLNPHPPISFWLILGALPLLWSATVFHCEQDSVHARFLVGQGVPARRIWWIRQGMGATILAIIGLPLCGVLAASGFVPDFVDSQIQRKIPAAYLGYMLTAYAAGQLVSITVRSSLIRFVVTAGVGTVLVFWVALCTFLEIPLWIWAGLPAVGCLLASRLRIRPVLLEWTSVRYWCLPALTLLTTLVLVSAAFTAYRVYEIPNVGPGFDVESFVQESNERFDADAARQLERAATAVSSLGGWLLTSRYTDHAISDVRDQAAEAIPWSSLPLPLTVLEQAAIDDASVILTPALDRSVQRAYGLHSLNDVTLSQVGANDILYLNRLARFYIVRARSQQREGEPESAGTSLQRALQVSLQLRRNGEYSAWWSAAFVERIALDNLLFWAADEQQDAERIEAMIDWLVQYWRDQPPWKTALQVQYLMTSRFISGLPESLDDLQLRPSPRWIAVVFLASLPSEKARSQRLLSADVAREINWIEQAQSRNPDVSGIRHRARQLVERQHRGARYSRTTVFGDNLAPRGIGLINTMEHLQTTRFATLVRLLFIEHRLSTGAYPPPRQDGLLPSSVRDRLVALVDLNVDTRLNMYWSELGRHQLRYRRVRQTEPDRYTEFHEPLGDFAVDVAGHLALIIGSSAYALPAFGEAPIVEAETEPTGRPDPEIEAEFRASSDAGDDLESEEGRGRQLTRPPADDELQ